MFAAFCYVSHNQGVFFSIFSSSPDFYLTTFFELSVGYLDNHYLILIYSSAKSPSWHAGILLLNKKTDWGFVVWFYINYDNYYTLYFQSLGDSIGVVIND